MKRKRTNRHKRKTKSKRASRTRWGREGGEKRTIKDHQNGREMERDKEKERERERERTRYADKSSRTEVTQTIT